jgi:hypothetical protein
VQRNHLIAVGDAAEQMPFACAAVAPEGAADALGGGEMPFRLQAPGLLHGGGFWRYGVARHVYPVWLKFAGTFQNSKTVQ